MTRFWINFLILESRITALLLNCIQRGRRKILDRGGVAFAFVKRAWHK